MKVSTNVRFLGLGQRVSKDLVGSQGSVLKIISINERGFTVAGLISMVSKELSKGRSNFENLISTIERSIINQRAELVFRV